MRMQSPADNRSNMNSAQKNDTDIVARGPILINRTRFGLALLFLASTLSGAVGNTQLQNLVYFGGVGLMFAYTIVFEIWNLKRNAPPLLSKLCVLLDVLVLTLVMLGGILGSAEYAARLLRSPPMYMIYMIFISYSAFFTFAQLRF